MELDVQLKDILLRKEEIYGILKGVKRIDEHDKYKSSKITKEYISQVRVVSDVIKQLKKLVLQLVDLRKECINPRPNVSVYNIINRKVAHALVSMFTFSTEVDDSVFPDGDQNTEGVGRGCGLEEDVISSVLKWCSQIQQDFYEIFDIEDNDSCYYFNFIVYHTTEEDWLEASWYEVCQEIKKLRKE